MLEKRYPEAERVVLVRDKPEHTRDRTAVRDLRAPHARQLAERLEIHYTPKQR